MLDYNIVMTDPFGRSYPDRYLNDFISLVYGRHEMEVGQLVIDLPDTHPPYTYRQHNRIYVWDGNALAGDVFWLVTKVERRMDENGGWVNQVTATDPNVLLTYRYAMDYSGDPRTVVIGECAQAIYEIVTNQLGIDATGSAIATNPARDISAYFEVSAPPTGTPLAFKTFAWQQLLSTIAALCQTSFEQGVYLTFDIVRLNNDKLQFRLYTGQRGIDRRGIITLSDERESLSNIRYVTDWTEAATAVVAAGQGEESDREVVYVVDQTRINDSPFGYIESFRDARHIDDLTHLQTEAYARLNDGRPRIFAQAALQERADSRWGIHFNFGDQVTVAVQDALFDARIRGFEVSVRDGDRTVKVDLEGQFRAYRRWTVAQQLNYLAMNESPNPP